jgi:hypothetical protein
MMRSTQNPWDLESSLHARFDDGACVAGVDASLWSWRAADFGVWAAPLAWRFIRPLFSVGYRLLCSSRPYLAWLPDPDAGRRCREDNRAV